MLSAIEEIHDRTIRCRADRCDAWYWPELLEASAQAAGLIALAGLDRSVGETLVAEFRDVTIAEEEPQSGPMWFDVTLVFRVLHFHRCRFTVVGGDGAAIVAGDVTLAISRPERASRRASGLIDA